LVLSTGGLIANLPANAGIIVCGPVRKARAYVQKIYEDFFGVRKSLEMPQRRLLAGMEECDSALGIEGTMGMESERA
jgi:hypothetical protein